MRNKLHLATRACALIALAASGLGLVGCQVVASSPQYTQVRFIDATPDVPTPGGLDVYQNTTVALYDIGFGTVSSYIAIPAGTYNYSVDVAGARMQLANIMNNFVIGDQYTILIGYPAASMQMMIVRDQTIPAPANRFAIRFFHQSTRNAPVDIYLIPAGSKITDVAPLQIGVKFGNLATYVDVPSGAYTLVVLPTGAVPGGTTAPLYTGSQVTYPATSARTVVFIDDQPPGAPGLQVITAADYDSPGATS
jgi:hypothetical protein